MVRGLYESILKEFSTTLKIEELEPDENDTCLIKFANDLEVYLEMDKTGENFIVGSDLGEIPLGGYRENVFRMALIANSLPFPRFGTFAFSNRSNSLVLFEVLPVKDLHGDQVAEFIGPFVQKGAAWKKAIENNEMPTVNKPGTTSTNTGMLGLK